MKGSTTNRRVRSIASKLLIGLFWLLVWQIVYHVVGRDIYVPSPYAVWTRLLELVVTSSFWQAIASSVFRVTQGILLSVLFGVLLGTAAGLYAPLHALLNPFVVAIKSTPVMSFIILALIWFSSSQAPVFICWLMCFPLIWTNTVEGIHRVDNKLLEMAQVYQVPWLTVLQGVYFRSVLPYFTAACITSLGLGWKVTIAAEVLSLPRGSIGSQLYSARVYLDSQDLFAWTVTVIVLSLLFEALFVLAMNRNKRLQR